MTSLAKIDGLESDHVEQIAHLMALGLATNGVVHDLTNPLNAIAMNAELGLAYLQQGMEIFSEAIVDRGGEGHLISLYYTPVAVLKRIRYEYGGVGTDIPPHAETIDAPPPPVD